MSNFEDILNALGKRCQCLGGACSRTKGGEHQTCSGKFARQTTVYPFVVCKGILQGIHDQLEHDRGLIRAIYATRPGAAFAMDNDFSEGYILGRMDESPEEFGPVLCYEAQGGFGCVGR